MRSTACRSTSLASSRSCSLKTAEGYKFLPIWIGHPEAAAILMKLQDATAPRPLTHDLLVNILGELEVEVVRVTVTELRENTFHASITSRTTEPSSRSTRARPTRSPSRFARRRRSSPPTR